MPINFSSTFRQWATWIAGILITDCPEASLTTKWPVHMAERNGQRGSTCFSSQMEDNTSNNGPRPFSATTTTTTTAAAEYCQHQRRLPLFGLCGMTWNYRMCFREDSCHDKVLGRPFHTYTHTITREYPKEHTQLSAAHTHRDRGKKKWFRNLIQGSHFAQIKKSFVSCEFYLLLTFKVLYWHDSFSYNNAKASINRLAPRSLRYNSYTCVTNPNGIENAFKILIQFLNLNFWTWV